MDGNTASALIDRFTSVDQKVDATNQRLDQILTELQAQRELQAQMVDAMTAIAEGAGAGSELTAAGPSEYPWELSTVVPNDTSRQDPHTTETVIDYDATITAAYIGFPAGTQQAVGVKIGEKTGRRWVPRGGVEQDASGSDAEYVALDDTVIPIDLNVNVYEGNPIQAEFVNNDPDNDHFVNVLLLAEEMEA